MCIQIPPIEKDVHIWHGKSEELLQHIEDNSIDSIVTDPPYGISFMGKNWDSALPPKEVWQECIQVLKPGGYIVAMSASRMYHRLAVQLEDLGLICHPMIGWIYGSGFPKATDLSKQFDKQDGVKRKIVGLKPIAKIDNPYLRGETKRQNSHPTVKPIALMEWLIKLVTPEGGITLDPFFGSGTTGIAAIRSNFKFIGIEEELDSFNIAKHRIEHAARQ